MINWQIICASSLALALLTLAPYLIDKALIWLPVIGNLRSYPHRFISIKLITGIMFIVSTIYFAQVINGQNIYQCSFEAIGLTFALALGLIDFQDRWLPGYVTVPMLLLGLMNSTLSGDVNCAVFGAAVAWLAMTFVITVTSVLCRSNFMSGGDMTMAASCGAWLGLNHLLDFFIFTGGIHLLMCLYAKRSDIPPAPSGETLDLPPVQCPMGPAMAMAMTISLVFSNCTTHSSLGVFGNIL